MTAALVGAFAAGFFCGVAVTAILLRRELRDREAWAKWYRGRRRHD